MSKRKAAITAAEAKRRGELLRRFREERLDVDQKILARLSDGWLEREEISNVERGETLWRSEKQAKGYAAILNITRDEVEDFVMGRMSENDVLAKAWPRVKEAKKRTETELAKERNLDARARSALARAGLLEVEFADSLIPPLRLALIKDPSKTDADLAETAKILHAIILRGEYENAENDGRSGKAQGDERESASHKIETQPPHRRR